MASVSINELLCTIDTESGRERLRAYLATRPYPHFESATQSGLFVKIDGDGRRTLGRFVSRRFIPGVAD